MVMVMVMKPTTILVMMVMMPEGAVMVVVVMMILRQLNAVGRFRVEAGIVSDKRVAGILNGHQ